MHLSRVLGLDQARAQQVREVRQVEGRGVEPELFVEPHRATQLGLAHRADFLYPTDASFDELADIQTNGVAPMARGARFDRARTTGVVLCQVRGGTGLAHCLDTVGSVVALVGAKRLAVLPRQP